jgi:hypothetical protein
VVRSIFAAALLAGMPVSAFAQMKASQPEAIADAVVDCWAAVGSSSVDTAVLGKRGWQAGSIQDPKGGQIKTPLQVYGKPGSNVVLMLVSTASSPACSIVSKVTAASDVSLAAQAAQRRLTAFDPQVKTARSGSSIVFLSLPKIATLDATGTKAAPGVRVIVSFGAPEKK